MQVTVVPVQQQSTGVGGYGMMSQARATGGDADPAASGVEHGSPCVGGGGGDGLLADDGDGKDDNVGAGGGGSSPALSQSLQSQQLGERRQNSSMYDSWGDLPIGELPGEHSKLPATSPPPPVVAEDNHMESVPPPPTTALRRYSSEPVAPDDGDREGGGAHGYGAMTMSDEERMQLGLSLRRDGQSKTPPVMIGGIGFERQLVPGEEEGGERTYSWGDDNEEEEGIEVEDDDDDGDEGDRRFSEKTSSSKERKDSWGDDGPMSELPPKGSAKSKGSPQMHGLEPPTLRRRWTSGEDMLHASSDTLRDLRSRQAEAEFEAQDNDERGSSRRSFFKPRSRSFGSIRSLPLPRKSRSSRRNHRNSSSARSDLTRPRSANNLALESSGHSGRSLHSGGAVASTSAYAGPTPLGPDGRPLKSCLSTAASRNYDDDNTEDSCRDVDSLSLMSSSFSEAGGNSKVSGTNSGTHSGGRLARSVSFNSITVREYERALGDHPCVSSGPALSLGWKYNESDGALSVDKWESERPDSGPRSKAQLVIPRNVREDMLRNQTQVSRSEIQEAIKEANLTKRSRMRNAKGVVLEETVETAKRKVKRVLTGTSKRKEEVRLWEEAQRIAMAKAAAEAATGVGEEYEDRRQQRAPSSSLSDANADAGATPAPSIIKDSDGDANNNNSGEEWGFGYDEVFYP